ncbi:ly6 plaur domain-containing protein 6b [Limosa lapponica baueri]|uniref:Ly6 plaur domain-containing protein 6b n=1 Tax=Limosa lapponica baueri TaxID=1758121 RepID=A0A2I0TCT7_LIMLA|nr:ly6 plaur domain-containing protein 6b [Limosa lapponica baueri]
MRRVILSSRFQPCPATPFPNSFKCFTCDNAVDNYNCNRWAEDRWCPESTQYCLTVHLFTDHGKSTSVTKKCATGEECHFVGCHHHRESGHTVSTAPSFRAAGWV